MYIVGIHDGHNASVSLMTEDKGEILFALQEERISKEKNASGFPRKAYTFMLDYYKITEDQISQYMVSKNHMIISKNVSTREKMLNRHQKNRNWIFSKIKGFVRNSSFYSIWDKRLTKKKLNSYKEHGINISKVIFVEHHKCHINTAYYCSHFNTNEKVLIVTADGGGGKLSATVSIAENGIINRKFGIPDTASLGYVYSGITTHMGMVPNEHEYKIMGLAPYAKSSEFRKLKPIFNNIIAFKGDDLIWKRASSITTFELGKYFDKKLKLARFDNIAGATQEFAEEMLVELILRNMKHFGASKVALSGGVFMNVKANQKISEINEIEDIFIMPSCGDETNAIGAAIEYFVKDGQTKDAIRPLGNDFCLGPKIDNETIGNDLEKYKEDFEIKYVESIEEEIAGLLANNEVVARVSGNMEFGARALGHRSILANPSSFENVKLINDMIKKRDFWMPFAGSYLEESLNEYILNPKNIAAPYMILTFDTIKEKRGEIEGAIHPLDKTSRPQVVNRETDADYWNIINEFKKLTGIGCLLNTSFNLHGLPVAFDVDDSMHVMINSGLNNLAIGNYLVIKKQK